jgi:hypothetical protein
MVSALEPQLYDTASGDRVGVKLDLVVFSLKGCRSCSALKNRLTEFYADTQLSHLHDLVCIHFALFGEHCEYAPAAMVLPRMYPTLILYRNGVAIFGWEGFASLRPQEIQHAQITDLFVSILNFANSENDARDD